MQTHILSTEGGLKCFVSPLVVMSILNFHQRRVRESPSKRDVMDTGFAVGLLFGKKRGNDIYISDCFPIPCLFERPQQESDDKNNEEEEEAPTEYGMTLSRETCKHAIEWFRESQPQVQLVGWFKSGLDVSYHSKTLHSHFMSLAKFYSWNPKQVVEKTHLTSIKDEVVQQSDEKSGKPGKSGKTGKNGNDAEEKTMSSNEFVSGAEFIHLMVDTELTANALNTKAFVETHWINPMAVDKFAQQQSKLHQVQTQSKKTKSKRKGKRRGANKDNKDNKDSKDSKDNSNNKDNANANANNNNNSSNSSNSNNNSNSNATDSKEGENDNKNEAEGKANENEEEEIIPKPAPMYSRFEEVPLEYSTTEPERIAIGAILNAPPDSFHRLDAPADLPNDTLDLEMTLYDLLTKLSSVEEYINGVRSGTYEPNEDIGWAVGEAVSAVPKISAEKFEKCMTNRLQDLLMISYLGKMTQAQLSIADKINSVLHRTIPKSEDNLGNN